MKGKKYYDQKQNCPIDLSDYLRDPGIRGARGKPWNLRQHQHDPLGFLRPLHQYQQFPVYRCYACRSYSNGKEEGRQFRFRCTHSEVYRNARNSFDLPCF